MRLDKYLKVSRLVKRRTIANEICDAGRAFINGKQVRASYEVKVGDVLELNMGSNSLKVQIVEINEYAKKEESSNMYRTIV